MDVSGLCLIETEYGNLEDGILDLGDCYPGLIKVSRLRLTNSSDNDLEILIQSSRPEEVLFLESDNLIDETQSVDVSLTKRVELLAGNNAFLSAKYSHSTFHRPLVDLLCAQLKIVVGLSIDGGAKESANPQELRSQNAQHSKHPLIGTGISLHGDCDGEKRYFSSYCKAITPVHLATITKLKKLQQKTFHSSGDKKAIEWRIQLPMKKSGYLYFAYCPVPTAIGSNVASSYENILNLRVQRPSSNMYALRRLLLSRERSIATSTAEAECSSPEVTSLSVSRSLTHTLSQIGSECSVFNSENSTQGIAKIVCRSNLSHPSLSLSHSLINFGDCNVGDFKSETITLRNSSTCSAYVVPIYESSTLTLSVKHLLLRSGQSCRIRIDYVAHIVDLAYAKKIYFLDLLNPTAELKLDIRARNMDTCQILLHDIFYKLYTYNASKQIMLYCKQCTLHRPNIRIFSVRNVYSESLVIRLSADDNHDVAIYALENAVVESDGTVLKGIRTMQHVSAGLEGARLAYGKSCTPSFDEEFQVYTRPTRPDGYSQTSDAVLHPIAVTECIKALYSLSFDYSKAIDQTYEKLVEKAKQKTSSHGLGVSSGTELDYEIEENVVRLYETYFSLFEKVNSIDVECEDFDGLSMKHLCELDGSNVVTIPVGVTRHFSVILTPTSSGSAEELECVDFLRNIHLQLLSVDKRNVSEHFRKSDTVVASDILGTSRSHIGSAFTNGVDGPAPLDISLTARTIPIHAFLTRSECFVMQKNINFGRSVIGEPAAKKSVVLVNLSSVPLLFKISKSRNIASEYMTISAGGHSGIIAPKSSRTFHITFKPVLAGSFEETLIVKNVMNPENLQSIVVKSVVVKPEKFVIIPSCDFVLNPPSNIAVDPLHVTSAGNEYIPPSSEYSRANICSMESIRTWMSKDSETHSVQYPAIYIGDIYVGEPASIPISFKVRNVSLKRRYFIIDASHSAAISVLRTEYCQFEPVVETLNSVCSVICQFKEVMEDAVVHSVALQNELKEKMEKYKQDLKKAERKNKTEKILKIKASILKIEAILTGKKVNNDDVAENSSFVDPMHTFDNDFGAKYSPRDDAAIEKNMGAAETEIPVNSAKDSAVFHFQLEPGKEISLEIYIRLIPGRSYVPWKSYPLPFVGQLRIFENKNEDLIKLVRFCALVHSQKAPSDFDNNSKSCNLSLGEPIVYTSSTHLEDTGSRALLESDKCLVVAGDLEQKHVAENREQLWNGDKLFLAIVAHWCSCQTKYIFPCYRYSVVKMLAVSCKLVQISASSSSNEACALPKMHGLISVTSMFPGTSRMKLNLETSSAVLPSEQYSWLIPEIHGDVYFSILQSKDDTDICTIREDETASGIEALVDEGQTVDILIQWSPKSRIFMGQFLTGVLALVMERVLPPDQVNTDIFDHLDCKNQTEISNLRPVSTFSESSHLYIPIVCVLEHSTSIKVEKYINLANIHLGSTVITRALVTNQSEHDFLHYVTDLVNFNNVSVGSVFIQILGGNTGVLGPGESKSIEISFSATALGRFEQELLVTNMNDSFDQKRILLSATVTMPQSSFVLFPDAQSVTDENNANSLITYFDLGMIQVHSFAAAAGYSYIGPDNYRPFRIVNVTSKILYVTAQSNLKRQCLVFADEACEKPLLSMPIQPRDTTTVFVTIRRSVNQAEICMQHNEEIENKSLRELVGGLRFIFYESETSISQPGVLNESSDTPYHPTLRKLFETRPIQIKAKLGCSILRMRVPNSSLRCVNTCYSGKNRVFRGVFHLDNLSPHFPARYKFLDSDIFYYKTPISASERHAEFLKNSNFSDCSVGSGEIKFVILDSQENVLNPGNTALVEYMVLFTSAKGLYSKNINLLNVITGAKQSVELNIFFDPQKLVSSITSNLLRGVTIKSSSGENVAATKRLVHKDGSAAIKYSEGVFVTDVDSVRCNNSIWVDKVSELTPECAKAVDSPRGETSSHCGANSLHSSSSIKSAKKNQFLSGFEDPSDRNCAYAVLGSSDPTGYMCEWSVYNALTTPLRVTPVSNLPVCLTTKLSVPSKNDYNSEVRNTPDVDNYSTVRKQKGVGTKADVFSKFGVFGPAGMNLSSDESDSRKHMSGERLLENSASFLSLPSGLWRKDLNRCGDAFTLNPGETAIVRLQCNIGGILPKSVSSLLAQREDTGSICTGDGVVAFVSAQHALTSFFRDPASGTSTAYNSPESSEFSEYVAMLPIVGYIRILCSFVTPKIYIPASKIVHKNLRPGQSLNVAIEVHNVSDVEVPISVKNLPEWIKLEKTGENWLLSSALHLPPRAVSFISLRVSKIPGSLSQTSTIILEKMIFICNMSRVFANSNYEKIGISLIFEVDPAVALLLCDEYDSPLQKLYHSEKNSCLFLGSLQCTLPCRFSPIVGDDILTPPLSELFPSCDANRIMIPLEVCGKVVTPAIDMLKLSVIISEASCATACVLRVRNTLSKSVRVDIDLKTDDMIQKIFVLKMFFQGGLVPVQNFDLLPGEIADFSIVTTATQSKTTLKELLFPIYMKNLRKRRYLKFSDVANEIDVKNDSDAESQIDGSGSFSDCDVEYGNFSSPTTGKQYGDQSACVVMSACAPVLIVGASSHDLDCLHLSQKDITLKSILMGHLILHAFGIEPPSGNDAHGESSSDFVSPSGYTVDDTITVDLLGSIEFSLNEA